MTDKSLDWLPDPKWVKQFIEHLEKTYPGWWYSLSFTPLNITVSLGPSRYSSDAFSRALAMTKEGDAGLIIVLTKGLSSVVYVPKIQSEVDRLLHSPDENSLTPIPEKTKEPRAHSEKTLDTLCGRLGSLPALVRLVNTCHTLDLKELYIGSCDLSADVSLRGTSEKTGEFDYSCDLHEPESLADALLATMCELISEETQMC